MLRYKLIKEYPQHEIGDVAIFDPEINDVNFIWEKTGKIVPQEFQCDVNKEWFEKITESKFKFKFKFKVGDDVVFRGDNVVFNVESVLSNGNLIFKGDKYEYDADYFKKYEYKLFDKVIFVKNHVFAKIGDISCISKIDTHRCINNIDYGTYLTKFYNVTSDFFRLATKEEIRASKPTLHITLDGVELKEGDEYYELNESYEIISYIAKNNVCSKRTFSTSKSAREYSDKILCISKDGEDIFSGDDVYICYAYSMNYTLRKNYIIPHSEYEILFKNEDKCKEYIQKHRILFTTDDGVELRAGDICYLVDMLSGRVFTLILYADVIEKATDKATNKIFYTKEKAEEFSNNYILISEDGERIMKDDCVFVYKKNENKYYLMRINKLSAGIILSADINIIYGEIYDENNDVIFKNEDRCLEYVKSIITTHDGETIECGEDILLYLLKNDSINSIKSLHYFKNKEKYKDYLMFSTNKKALQYLNKLSFSFITEDGVEIIPNENIFVYGVPNDDYFVKHMNSKFYFDHKKSFKDYVIFSTSIEAVECLNNRLLFTTEDGFEINYYTNSLKKS